MSHYRTVTFLALPLCLLSTAAIAIDENSNGLSDVWEQRFNASALQLLDDADGDGFKNMEECIAGTDPYDSTDHPKLNPLIVQENADEIKLTFNTLIGKHYTVSHSRDLNSFNIIPPAWSGDGVVRTVTIETDALGEATTKYPVIGKYWTITSTDSITDLTDLETFPLTPDGIANHSEPEAHHFIATGYGAQIRTWITPPQSGTYTFFLSSSGPAELLLCEQPEGTDSNKIAEVLATQSGIIEDDWDHYGTQRASPATLSSTERYQIELRYVGKEPNQHVQIGWSGPGITGIQALNHTHLADLNFQPNARSGVALLHHDYDSLGQTGKLWPNNTTLVTGTSGMTGYAQRINGDVGNSAEERLHFPATSQHLYTSFLFNMGIGAMPQDNYLYFMNGDDTDQEGPRIDIEDSGGTLAVVRAGGAGGGDEQINIEWGQTYRIEMLATLSADGFPYETPTGTATVAQDTFDLYVSAQDGTLIGAETGLAFRDGAGVVDQLSSLRLGNPNNPQIVYDDWEFTSGLIVGNGYLPNNLIDFHSEGNGNFFKLSIQDLDQDLDGIPDWEELALAEHYEFLFFDAQTTNGTPDADALALLLAQSQGKPEITLYGSDAAAFESNYPNTTSDNGEIIITRTGTLEPLAVDLCFPPLEEGTSTTICDGTCCMLIGSAGDEEAEPEDYILTDEDGTVVTDTVNFAFGEIKKVLTLTAVDDPLNEYPESVNLAIKEAVDARYDVSEILNGASIQIFDLPDSADNLTIFTGSFSQDGNAVVPTSGSGYATATINGPRTEIRLWDEFSGLTSAQQDSHVHKANAGNTAGNIIYAITETPGDDETDPLNGPLTNYLWDLTDSSGAVPSAGGAASKQVIIDSLFGQNAETPLYLNVHTVDNPAGEIWAFLNLSGGSAEDPGDAPAAATAGSGEYPQLSGDLLESEVRRFLNQATFGATDSEVAALVHLIETQRLSNPAYHRSQAYADWIDAQMSPSASPQTYLLDFTLASVFQRMTLAGLFDSSRNPTDGTTDTPTAPATWPSIDRSSSNPEHWYLTTGYPVTRAALNLGNSNGLSINTTTGNGERRNAHWQTMLNARDQLRQKMGYALQQIVVVSATNSTIANNAYAATNYQDMLNTHAFGHYRDVLGYVNWSPIMGKWLSSLQNQKAIDFDGDGLFDSYPDENLARENMQLFSIGLFNIWSDGTLKLSSEGLPSSTYTNDDIREFAKILTGQSFSQYATTTATPAWGGVPYAVTNPNFSAAQGTAGQNSRSYLYPMKMFGDYHSLGAKSFAGTTIDNSNISDPDLQGIADIEAAIDWLAGTPGDGQPDFDMVHSHVSTPAFISRRLIQRFTTSNPSQDYLHRVATVFKNSEGDLALTLRAILLDPEARNIDLDDTRFGMKKSPLEGYLQLLRTLQAHTYLPLTNPDGAAPFDVAAGDYSNPDIYLENFQYPSAQLANFERNVRFAPGTTFTSGTRGLQMDPFTQETVFNFYLPDFSPGGAVGAAGMVAPELQLANEPDIIRNINFFEDIIRSDQGPGGDELGGTDDNQEIAFNSVDADRHDYQRLDRQALADAFYPAVEPASGITTEATGDTESIPGTSSVSGPHWVRLTRSGDAFVTSESIDGITWIDGPIQMLPMASEVYIGLALTSHDDGTLTTAEFSNVTVTGGAGAWYSSDIGSVAAAGSTVDNGSNTFTLQGSGNDIWNSADEFHFAYQLLNGDGQITARVDSLVVTNVWAKAGVMIRETLDANSANVISLISGSYGTRAQIRRVPRGRSSESIADEALVDELDRRLTYGFLKLRYPYDTSDNDDPNIYGVDETLKNPRELIIDAITNGYGDPFDGSNDESDRLNKFADALYLLTFSPEYQIKK